MTMEDPAAASVDEREEQVRGQQLHARIDWRTGRPMQMHDAAFWHAHVARRVEQGLSVKAYCEANGLAKSTFRRYATTNGARSPDPRGASSPAPSRFVPVATWPAWPPIGCCSTCWSGSHDPVLGDSGVRVHRSGGHADPARLGSDGIAMSELIAWLEGIDSSGVRRLRAVTASVVASRPSDC